MTRGKVVQVGQRRGAVRAAGPHLRRPLHRLAGHELPAGAMRRRAAADRRRTLVAAGERRCRDGRLQAGHPARVRAARRARYAQGALPATVTQVQDIGTAPDARRQIGRRQRAEGARSRPTQRDARVPATPCGCTVLGPHTCYLRQRGAGRMKVRTINQKAWLLVLPVLICVAFSAILPLMTVVNYSVQDIISPERRVFVGTEWFAEVMRDDDLHAALLAPARLLAGGAAGRDPAGHRAGAGDAGAGWRASVVLVLVALPLLIPWNVVGTIWQIFGRADIGLLGRAAEAGHRLQLHRQRHRRLAHRAGDGRVALDAAGGAAVLRRPARHPRCLLPGGAHRRRQRWRCSATSSCPRCAAC